MIDPALFLLIPFRSHDVNISSTDDDLTVATEFQDDGVDMTASPPAKIKFARRIYVGTGGDVVLKKLNDTGSHKYKNVANGTYLDGAWITVVKSGTTAADMVAEQ